MPSERQGVQYSFPSFYQDGCRQKASSNHISHGKVLFDGKNYVFEFSVTRIPQGNQQRNREGRTEVSKLSCHKMTKLSLAITFFNAVENRSQRLSRSFNKK